MGKQLNLEEMIAQAESAKKEYMELLHSGMFFEWYPDLTGDWNKDEIAWNKIYEEITKFRQEL